MSNTFKWKNPPAHATRRGPNPRADLAQAAERLRENPGRWALIRVVEDTDEDGSVEERVLRTRASAMASNIKQGRYAAFRADDDGEFEAQMSGVEVYARYVLFSND